MYFMSHGFRNYVLKFAIQLCIIRIIILLCNFFNLIIVEIATQNVLLEYNNDIYSKRDQLMFK